CRSIHSPACRMAGYRLLRRVRHLADDRHAEDCLPVIADGHFSRADGAVAPGIAHHDAARIGAADLVVVAGTRRFVRPGVVAAVAEVPAIAEACRATDGRGHAGLEHGDLTAVWIRQHVDAGLWLVHRPGQERLDQLLARGGAGVV